MTPSEALGTRVGWLGTIQELADYEMQRATWLNPLNNGATRNPHYSFHEFFWCYYSLLQIGIVPDPYQHALERGWLTPAHVEAVSEFHALLLAYEPPTRYSVRYGDEYNEEAILRDPKWLEVVAAAQSARDRLLKLAEDPREVKALTRRSIHARLAAAKSLFWYRVLKTWIELWARWRRYRGLPPSEY